MGHGWGMEGSQHGRHLRHPSSITCHEVSHGYERAALQPPNVIPSTPRRGVLHQMRKQWSAYLFLAPTMILFGIFTVAAVIYAFYLSFHEWNILEPAKPFVGLDNYSRLLGDERFGGAIVNTLYYTAASVP